MAAALRVVAAVALMSVGLPHHARAATPAQLAIGMSGTHDSVKPGEPILYTITVSNTGGTASTAFSVTATLPAATTTSKSSAEPGPSAWSCTNTSACQPGDTFTWNLSSGLAPGASTTLQFESVVAAQNAPPDGTSTTASAVATLGTSTVSTSVSVTIDSRPWPTLDLNAATSIVTPGGSITWLIDYGNPGSTAINGTLSLAIPTGTTVSSSDGGTIDNGAISWNLGSLPAGSAGRHQITLAVGSGVAAGTLLNVSAALYDTNTAQSYARAGRVAPVEAVTSAPLLTLAMTATPDPVQPGQTVLYQITVSNVGGSASSAFSVAVGVPAHATTSTSTAMPGVSGWTCANSASCQPGETLYWNVSSGLAAGASTTVQFSATVQAGTPPPDGTLITTSALTTAIGANGGAQITQSAAIATSSPDLAIAGPSLAVPGADVSYVLDYGNPSDGAVNGSLSIVVPPGLTFVSASNGGTFSNGTVTWALNGIPVAASGQRQVTLQVGTGVANGTLLDVAANLYDTASLQSYARASTATPALTLGSAPQLALTVAATPDPALPGQTVLYQVTVSNVGGSTSSGFTVGLTVPQNTTTSTSTASPGVSGWTCATSSNCEPGDTLWWNISSGLAAGASTTLQFSATIDADDPPPDGTVFTLAATTTPLGTAGGVAAVQNVTVSSTPVLDLALSAPSLVAPGGTLTYVVNYGNPSGSPVNAGLALVLPAGTTVVSASNGASVANGTVTWAPSDIAAGASGQERLTLSVGSGVRNGTLLSASANLYDGQSLQSYARADQTTTAQVLSSTPLITLSVRATPDPVRPGQTVLYQITAANVGGSASDGFTVSVAIPPDMSTSTSTSSPTVSDWTCATSASCQPGDTLSWNVSSGLAAGASTTVQFTATVDASYPPPDGTLATLAATTTPVGTAGGAAAVQAVTVTANPVLDLDMAGPSSVMSGAPLTYVLDFSNPTVSAAEGSLSLTAPPGTTFVSASDGGTFANGTLVWNLGTVAPGASGQRQVTLQVDSGSTNGTFLALAADLYDSNTLQSYARTTASPTVFTPNGAPQIALSMTATPDPVRPGQTVLYQITAANVGGSASTGFTISVPIPENATSSTSTTSPTVSDWTCATSASCQPGDTLSWNVSSGLAAGASTTVQFSATVNASYPPPPGTMIGTSATMTPLGSAGGATVRRSVIVTSHPELALQLVAPSTGTPGSTLVYVLNYGNPSGSAVNGALSVPLPAGTSFVSASNGGTLSGGAVMWDLGSIPAGASGQLQLILQAGAAMSPGTLLETAAELYDPGTLQSYARTSGVTPLTAPGSGPQITLSMSATPDPVLPGQTVLYQITVTNVGTSASGAFTVSVPIPEDTTSSTSTASPGVSGWTCANSSDCQPGDTLSWNISSGLAAGASTVLQFSATVFAGNPPPNGTLITTSATMTAIGVSGGARASIGSATGEPSSFTAVESPSASSSTNGDAPLPLWAWVLLAVGLLGVTHRLSNEQRRRRGTA